MNPSDKPTDERITKLKTIGACEAFARNAGERGRPDLAAAAIRRTVELNAEAYGAKSQAEKECLRAVYALERARSGLKGKTSKASRTWQMITRHGILEAVESTVMKPQETVGYTTLVEMGLEEYAFEAVVIRHPEAFSEQAVQRSKERMQRRASGNRSESSTPGVTTRTTEKAENSFGRKRSAHASQSGGYSVISSANQIADAQQSFERTVQSQATEWGILKLGYQGGGREVMVHFIGPLRFWVGFADSSNRYWNALGLGNPFNDGHTIIAEINPSKDRINRRVSGLFLADQSGKTYLAHRGRVGGGRKGIGQKAFFDWYAEPTCTVDDGFKSAEVVVIGALEDDSLLERLAAFTRQVAAFKEDATQPRP